MFNKLLRKKRVLVGLTVAMLAVAGAAFAYFTSEGSGTGHGTVGTSTALEVIPATPTGTMYPGAGESTFTYTVKNNSTGHQGLTGTSVEVASTGGNITEKGVEVAGCKASWFHAANTAPTPLPQDLASGASSSAGSVKVTMDNSETEVQDPCKGKLPDITVKAS
jgi:hypothetical protein